MLTIGQIPYTKRAAEFIPQDLNGYTHISLSVQAIIVERCKTQWSILSFS